VEAEEEAPTGVVDKNVSFVNHGGLGDMLLFLCPSETAHPFFVFASRIRNRIFLVDKYQSTTEPRQVLPNPLLDRSKGRARNTGSWFT